MVEIKQMKEGELGLKGHAEERPEAKGHVGQAMPPFLGGYGVRME